MYIEYVIDTCFFVLLTPFPVFSAELNETDTPSVHDMLPYFIPKLPVRVRVRVMVRGLGLGVELGFRLGLGLGLRVVRL